jgi:hypothetical protein
MKTFTVVAQNISDDDQPLLILHIESGNEVEAAVEAIEKHFEGDVEEQKRFWDTAKFGDIVVHCVEVKTGPLNLKTYRSKP